MSPDTDPAAEAVQLEIYRRMPPGQKISLVLQANALNRSAVRAGLRQRHPEADESEIERRLHGLVWVRSWRRRSTVLCLKRLAS